MIINKSKVNRILVITLSNVGDVILTTPVIKTLKAEFPTARIDVMVGPRGKDIFEKDPHVFELIIYDKRISIAAKYRLQIKLKKTKYNLVVDLKNTIFPIVICPKYRTAIIQRFPKSVVHAIDRHLYRLKSMGIEKILREPYLHIPKEDEEYVSSLLAESNINRPIVLVSPGAKSHLKRWTAEGFAKVSDKLARECRVAIVFIGTGEDKILVDDVIKNMKTKPYDFVDRTNIRQLASLMKRAKLLITNDSAPLHLGCAVGTKVLAVFGPTDPKRYGPIGEFDVVVRREHLFCSPCEIAVCKYNYECMKLITAHKVFDAARMMIKTG